MFSGIVKSIGEIVSIQEKSEHRTLAIRSELFSKEFAIGSSICVCGVCLTLVKQDALRNIAEFEVGSETLRSTTLGSLQLGDAVNLEPSLVFGGSIDGHFVSGHVDTVSEIKAIREEGQTRCYEIFLPQSIKNLVIKKGSIAIDGISLTVGEVAKDSFNVYLFPYTIENTTFKTKSAKDKVNLEADILARYISGQIKNYV